MAMRSDWVDAIFARLELAYGARFALQWGAVPAATVKAAWAAELDGHTSRGIAHALAHLNPDFPPNAMQFRVLCQCAPGLTQAPLVALAGPRPTPASVERLKAVATVLTKPKDPRAWAQALKAREEAGEHLSPFQRKAWRTSSVRTSDPSNGAGSSVVEP